ncbi:MAG: glycosyltransferase family 39 protein [Alphaproteobacteria bacterium]
MTRTSHDDRSAFLVLDLRPKPIGALDRVSGNLFRNLPLDVMEGLVWGHGWPLGTYKHPPLQAWILEIASVIGGHSDAAIYATGAGSLFITYVALWQLGKMLLPPAQAATGVLAMAACFYFATTIPEFNPNVVQIPLYALCGLFFWRGFRHDRLKDWLIFGLCAGLGMWGKYTFVLLLTGFPIFMLWEPQARRYGSVPAPYSAALTATLVFLPHLIWLIGHDWLPMQYAASRTEPVSYFWERFWWPVMFLLTQLLAIGPSIAIIWLARERGPKIETTPTPQAARLYLTLLAFAPRLVACRSRGYWRRQAARYVGHAVLAVHRPVGDMPVARRFRA